MAKVEEEYKGRSVELRAAMVLVDLGVTDEDGDHWTHVRWLFGAAPEFDHERSSSAYAAGVCAEALVGLTAGGEIDEADDAP